MINTAAELKKVCEKTKSEHEFFNKV